jgi:hypothetical protein
MADKKNIVIKVKYPKAGKNPEKHVHAPASGMITEWNFKRIWLAIGIAVLIIVVSLLIFINRVAQKKNTANPAGFPVAAPVRPKIETAPANEVVTGKKITPEVKEPKEKSPLPSEPSGDADDSKASGEPQTPADNKHIPITSIKSKEIINKQPGLIKENGVIKETLDSLTNKNVARASLTYKINNKEPVGEISSSVKVRKTRATPVYYFTELRKMKGQKVYHQWFRNNKLVFSQELIIAADRWRTSSHKLLTYKDKGNWVIKLVNNRKQLLNKKSFTVN